MLAIGDELLTGIQDTNGPGIAGRLQAAGFVPAVRMVVPDDQPAIARSLKSLLAAHDLVVMCGGLGPTQDDLTRQAAAEVLGCPLEFHNRWWQNLERRFLRRGRSLAPNNRIQAMIPKGAKILPNPLGTAAGFCVRMGKCWVAALPGPPRECLPMLETQLLPSLQKSLHLAGPGIHRCWLRTCGLSESGLQALLGPIYQQPDMPELGFLLDEPGEILVGLTVRALPEDQARRRLARGCRRARAALGVDYVAEGRVSLPAAVGRLLARKQQTLAVAESCTGGLVCRRLTSIPGSSRYFLEGAVTYANTAKSSRLGVPKALLARTGAVSEAIAMAMATGMRRRSHADWALAVTGIAGPGGGTIDKPVGLVHIALTGPAGRAETQTLHLWDERDYIQRRSATAALDLLRRNLKLPAGKA